MLRETTDWYERSLTAFLAIKGPLEIKVILTDREPALATALEIVLPNVKQIYCIWHIEKNIATNCKNGLTKEEFSGIVDHWKKWIVQAATEEGLREGTEALRSKYQPKRQFETILDYIDNLLHDRTRYVHAWTDRHLHLGQRNTSRVEGAHRALKDTLNKSNSDLFMVITRISSYMKAEYTEVVNRMERERVKTSTAAGRLFDMVRTTVDPSPSPI